MFFKIYMKLAFGGNLRLVLVGSAPLSPKVLDYARCALGCAIVEGYGQTECGAPITLTVPGDCVSGHVGPPLACCCIKVSHTILIEFIPA